MNILFVIPALGIVGLLFMTGKAIWVSKQDAGNKKMIEIAGYISRGAMAFLHA